MTKLLAEYPDINVEIINDYGLVDIVAERYDAGVRLGDAISSYLEDENLRVTGTWVFFIDHPFGADPSSAFDAPPGAKEEQAKQ